MDKNYLDEYLNFVAEKDKGDHLDQVAIYKDFVIVTIPQDVVAICKDSESLG